MGVGGFFVFRGSLRIIPSLRKTCSRQYANGRRIASFRHARATRVDGGLICEGRRVDYVTLLRHLSIGVRVRVRFLCIVRLFR